ncbi:MAG: YtxH domain-containing protein [Candidatus Limnocylindria bacterium]
MPTRPAKTAEDVAETIADTVKSIIDRVVDSEVTKEIARRGGDVAEIIAERGADVGERATEAWKETRPLRREAAKRVSGATGDAAKWSDGLWRGAVAPALSDLWKRRTVAAGAAGAAVPVSRELLESAAVRLGLKERQRDEERRRWGAFFLGSALGAIAGTIAALLTTPKRGSDVRRELGVRAEEVRRELGVKADEIAARAREADWMPVFQREGESGNGHTTSPSTTTVGDVAPPATTAPKPSAAKPRTTSRELGQPATGTTPVPKPATTPRKKRVDPGSPA